MDILRLVRRAEEHVARVHAARDKIILRMWQDGFTLQVIADVVGLKSKQLVQQHIQRLGGEPRNKKKKAEKTPSHPARTIDGAQI